MGMVKSEYLRGVLVPFMIVTDEEAADLLLIDADDEDGIREVIRTLIVPYFSRFDEGSKDVVRQTIQHYLESARDSLDSRRLLEDTLEEFSALRRGRDVTRFFGWLWDELFHSDVGPHICTEECWDQSNSLSINEIRLAPGVDPTWIPRK